MDIPALHTLTNGIIIGICLSISFGLVCFKQMAHAINPKYRRACHFFIAASLIIAAGHLAELLVDGFGVYRSLDLFSILVLVLASSQALMFTFMLILLFDSRYVTFANVMKHAAPSLVFILLYVVSCCIEADVCVYSLAEWRACVVHNLPLAVRTLFGVTYTVQLFVYVRLFSVKTPLHHAFKRIDRRVYLKTGTPVDDARFPLCVECRHWRMGFTCLSGTDTRV